MNSEEIDRLGRECRALADKGAKLNWQEAILFKNSLRIDNLSQCWRLVETLKLRTNK